MSKRPQISNIPREAERVRPWRKWNGRYQKEFYDVRTSHGEVFMNCWPNAGTMNTTAGARRCFTMHMNIEIRLAAKPLF